jgi:hypothetical protein
MVSPKFGGVIGWWELFDYVFVERRDVRKMEEIGQTCPGD